MNSGASATKEDGKMKCANKICRFRTEENDCVGAPVTPEECRLHEPQTLTTQKDTVADVPCNDGVMPARVTEGTDFYQMQFSDGGMYAQRKYIRQATDSPLSLKEIVIIKLCETMLGKQA